MQRHQWLSVRLSFRTASLAFLSLCSGFALGHLLAAYAEPSASNEVTLNACGSTIAVQFVGDAESRDDLLRWINRAAAAVCTYYGGFPVPHLTLVVHTRGGPGVHHGVTYPRNGGFITISVGFQTRVSQLDEDWMLTHEMIHLAFPSMAAEHHWIEEGVSVYVEPVARVQAGQLLAAKMWSDVIRDMP